VSVEDRLAILEIITRYSFCWDERETDAFAELFAEDAVFQTDPEAPNGPVIRNVGREAIREWARGRHASHDLSKNQARHIQTGTLFDELTPDRATTRTMLLITRFGPELGDFGTGVYYDEWVKTAEGWRFASRTLRHDFPEIRLVLRGDARVR
jgi:hypothetical protein